MKKMKLVCFDMDGVLYKDINFRMSLHKALGTLEEGKILTKKYLHSDYNRLIQEVVGNLWKDKETGPYFSLINSLEYNEGIDILFKHIKEKGYLTAIITASTLDAARRIQREYGIDFIFANSLGISNNKFNGTFFGLIEEGYLKKQKIVKQLAHILGLELSNVIFIGDSDNDVEAASIAGTSIAFNATSDQLRAVATHIVDTDDLSNCIRYIL
ncbi:MAG: HAD family hydrolase [Candidatus Woesearchaeota archaeon]